MFQTIAAQDILVYSLYAIFWTNAMLICIYTCCHTDLPFFYSCRLSILMIQSMQIPMLMSKYKEKSQKENQLHDDSFHRFYFSFAVRYVMAWIAIELLDSPITSSEDEQVFGFVKMELRLY